MAIEITPQQLQEALLKLPQVNSTYSDSIIIDGIHFHKSQQEEDGHYIYQWKVDDKYTKLLSNPSAKK